MNTYEFLPSGGNRTPEIVDTLTHAPEHTVLHFAPGTYDFYEDGAYRDIFYPICNRSGDKKVIFPLIRMKDITIDGGGADFVFHDRVSPFIACRSEGVTFRNFTVDFSFPRCCVCDVISVSDEGILLDVSKSGSDVSVTPDGNLKIMAGSDEFSNCEWRFFLKQGLTLAFLASGEIFFDTSDRPAPFFFCDAEQTEKGIFLRARPGSEVPHFKPGKLMISYDELRENDVFFIDRCSDVCLEHTRIYHGAGMGCASQLTHNLTFDHYVVAPPEGSGDVYSTTADAILLANCTGKVDVRHCIVRKPMDDALAVGGLIAVVEKITAPRKAVLRLKHDSHAGFNPYFEGDRVMVVDGETVNEVGSLTVRKSFFRDDMYEILIEFEEDVRGKLKPGDYLENNLRLPEISVTDCEFSDFPSVRIATRRSVYFARNHLSSFYSLQFCDILQYWYSEGVSRHVTIENNIFENADTPIMATLERPEDSNVRHSFMSVKGNTFKNCRCLINADAVHIFEFTGNHFDEGFVRMKRVTNANIQPIKGAEDAYVGQLLMRWKPEPVQVPECPEGYRLHQYHRGGDDVLSEEQFEKGWLNCVFQATPCDHSNFEWLINDRRVPDDGFFVILDAENNVVSTASVQMNEFKPDSATLHMVYTDMNARGKGLAKIVSLAAMRYMYQSGVPEAYLTTDDFRFGAVKIYLKSGYLPVLYTPQMRPRWMKLLKKFNIAETKVIDENGEKAVLKGAE